MVLRSESLLMSQTWALPSVQPRTRWGKERAMAVTLTGGMEVLVMISLPQTWTPVLRFHTLHFLLLTRQPRY